MAVSKEIRIGILALVSGVVLYFGFNYLKGSDLFSNKEYYYAIYPNAEGLNVSNPITVNGVQVGQVAGKTLLQNRGNQVLITLDIEKEVKLNDSTVAIVASTGLLGGKEIKLLIGKGGRPLDEGDTLISQIEVDMLGKLAEEAKPLSRDLDTALYNLNVLLKQFQQISKPLGGTLQNLENTSSALNGILAQNQAAIKGILTNLNAMSGALNDPQTGVKPLMAKLNATGDSLSRIQLGQTVDKANASLANISKLLNEINQGQGSLGKLAKNDSLYNNLNRFSANLDSLMVDFREHPKRYIHFSVFGKKDKIKK
ncbi:MlaD family protein [Xanthocytophaga flava]|uniref:MlaD family protein n=1 Tax=Xanthocytophaga flava TaxID=3048013 RepID=UPI0028D325F5|nr:MlaD family protein [Xanthocytophaga flavus]MDJ1467518.1 MlaD family protein [Xanthocytophaga flavus]